MPIAGGFYGKYSSLISEHFIVVINGVNLTQLEVNGLEFIVKRKVFGEFNCAVQQTRWNICFEVELCDAELKVRQ